MPSTARSQRTTYASVKVPAVMGSLALTLADIQTEGRDVVVGMLIVGLVIVGVIVLGELAGWVAHRRK